MKLEKLVGERFKERPSDCVIDSHALMLRGGYMKYVANGIYSSYLPLRRITRKIEQIIREEMDRIDGQEVQFPVVLPASLWQESGRYESVGSELMRFSDRNNTPLVLGMTHEEAAVHLVREYGLSNPDQIPGRSPSSGGAHPGAGVYHERRLFFSHQPSGSGILLRPVLSGL